MLMITIQNEVRLVTFRLEGRLAGAGVRELARHWSSAVFKQPHQRVLFDLAGVTSVDVSGREFLARAYEYGDILIGGAATEALVEGIRARAAIARSASEAPHRPDTGAEDHVQIVGDHPSREANLRRDGELAREAYEDQQSTGETAGDHPALQPLRVYTG